MSETSSQFSPEGASGPFSFKIGDESFGVEGGFTEGKFTGTIRGADGKDFAGLVEDLGGGRYRIEDWEGGRIIESPAEAGSPAAEVPVGGLEDAAAVAAMEAAPEPSEGEDFGGYHLVPDAEGGIQTSEKLVGAIIGPDGKRFYGTVKKTADGLKVVGGDAGAGEGFIITPAKKIVGRVTKDAGPVSVLEPSPVAEPAAEPEPEPEPEPQPAPTPAAEVLPEPRPAEGEEPVSVESPTEENRHPLVVELQQKMRSVSRPLRAVRLWKQGESARSGVEGTKSKAKIERLFTQERELKDQAKEFYPGIEKMTDEERGKLSRKTVPLSAEGATEDIRISSPRHREDMAVFYEAELKKWENILRDPRDFEQYQTERAEVESQKSAARQLFSEESDRRLLDQAITRIEQKGSSGLKALEARLPRRLLELAGFIPSESPTLEQVQSDMDLRLAYNRAAQRLYSELTGQPQAAVTEIPAAPEPIAPLEPVEQPVVEATVEEVMPSAEVVAEPEVAEQAAEVPAPPAGEEEAAPEPIEVPTEAPVAAPVEAPIPGEVVVDAAEQARATAERPAEIPAEEKVGAPTPTAEAAAAPVEAPLPEAPQVKAELTPEQIKERAERRRNNFADAVAQLEEAYIDNSGTQAERVGRVVERVRGIILAGLELAEEGGAAQEVVMTVLGKLNNKQNGRLVQAAVGQAPEQVEQAVGNTLRARGAFGPDGKPKSRKELEDAGLVGLIELLLQLGMSFTDASINAVITEVQSATGAGR